MKKIIIFLLLFSNLLLVSGQKGAIYTSFQPADLGVGIRGNYHFQGIGVYGSVSYGNGGLYSQHCLIHHVKSSLGIMLPMFRYVPENILYGNKFFFTTAINYHSIGNSTCNNNYLDSRIFNPWSFELGITTYTTNRFTLGVRTDILRWEPCIDIGIKF